MLQPSAFPALPAAFRAELEKRGCLIPQQAFFPESSRAIPNNIIKGQFAAKGQTDWAVLCSKDWQSLIIVFWQKPSSCPSEFGLAEDEGFLQDDGHGHMVYSRGIDTLGKAGLRENADPEYRPLIKHDGIEDAFIGRGSGYSYCHKGKWMVVGNSKSLE